MKSDPVPKGRLILVATPIGNLEDICDMLHVACHDDIRQADGHGCRR